MSLSADFPSRVRKHTRSIRFEGYAGYARAGICADASCSPESSATSTTTAGNRSSSTAAMRSIPVASRCTYTIRAGGAKRKPVQIDAD